MDPYDLNVPTYLLDSVFPFGDFLCEDEPSESSSASTAPTTFSPSIGGQYQLNGASLFDTEYIDPALLKGPDTAAMGNLINDFTFPAMQYTQNESSPYHPERQSPATDFEQQQQMFLAQQGVSSSEVVFPNALDTSAQGDASFDWPGAQQEVHGPTGKLAFSQREHFAAFRHTTAVLPGTFSESAQVPAAPMRCEWPSCKKESFFTKEHFTQHLHRHRDEARVNFVIPGVCQWPGCRSRNSGVIFQTEAHFTQHLKLHMKSHWCDVPGCKHGEGFARQYDLTRHLKTHSKERAFNCPDSSCASSSLGFSRKDKLDAHIKTRHPHLIDIIQSRRCNVHGCTVKNPFDSIEDLQAHFVTAHEDHRPHRCLVEKCTRHVNGFTTRGKLVEHIKAEHDPPNCTFDHCGFRSLGNVTVEHIQRLHQDSWECRLPGCEGSRSRFSYERFRTHLSDHHDIGGVTYNHLVAADLGDESIFLGGTFVTCKYCSERRAQSDENEVSRNQTV
ncbi:uncharacterized protein PAC_05515 [Phialocephala subalpina]|uniref:C2H2-type domain-containing protein n=1 Tax=Phialocephala subalpina TaxID=576137 RepID=A0A1L7WS90_9HELO|nr:uncharacterized protein PAC_05515 [Phialocephala subalpina]